MLRSKLAMLTTAATVALLAGCAAVERAFTDVDEGFQIAVSDVRAALKGEDSSQAAEDTLHATRLMDGDGVARNPVAAVALLRRHAENGYADAQFLLGLAYASGQGVPADKTQAVDWYRKAALRGQAQSQYLLGLALMRGDGVAEDTDRAAYWFLKGAENGNAGAQYHLALGYAASDRPSQALVWFEKAAMQDHGDAQYLTGEFYHLGRGTPRNRAWATRWFGKAAMQGMARAQYMLGLAYAAPSGVPRSLETAYRWMALAARNGEARADKYRDGLSDKLSTTERHRADAAVAAWRPSSDVRPFDDRPTMVFVQYSLARAGFDPGPVDGLTGPRTRDAIARYRSARAIGSGPAVTSDLLISLKKERRAAS